MIAAPRGAGKSVMVETWLASEGAKAREVVVVPQTGGGESADSLWRAISAALRGARGPLTIVLDHPDRADGGGVEHGLLALLRDHRDLSLVVVTRASRLFAECSAGEPEIRRVARGDLRFTADETAEWLRGNAVRVDDAVAAAIHRHIGGAPRLLRTVSPVIWRLDGAQTEDALASVEVAILAVVEREAFGPLGREDFGTLVAGCAILGSMTASQVGASAAVLDWLADIDDLGVTEERSPSGESAWTLVPAVQAAVGRILEEGLSPCARRLVSGLGRRLLEGGDVRGALACGSAVRDWDLAWPVLREHWLQLAAEDMQLVRDAFLRVPVELVRQDVWASGGRAIFAGFDAGHVSALPEPDDGPGPHGGPHDRPHDGSHDGSDPEAMSLAAWICGATVQTVIMRLAGQLAEANALTDRIMEAYRACGAVDLQEMAPYLSLLRVHWGLTRQLMGDLAGADELWRLSIYASVFDPRDMTLRAAVGARALNWVLAGDLARAAELDVEEVRFDEVPGWFGTLMRTPGQLARVLMALEKLDLQEAQRQLEALGSTDGMDEYWAVVAYARLILALLRGQPEVGLDVLRRAENAQGHRAPPGSLVHDLLRVAEANLHLSAGRGNDALRVLRAASRDSPAARVSRARLRLLTGDAQAALVALQGLKRSADIAPGSAIAAALIEASALVGLGQLAPARAAVERAIAVSAETGHLAALHSLPRGRQDELVAAGVVADSLRAVWAQSPRPPRYPDEIGLVELAQGELRVLALLAEGLPTPEIAARLAISLNTVKSQLRVIYRKLGANTREGAIQAARRHSLI